MSQMLKKKFADPGFVLTILGGLAGIALLAWLIQRIRSNTAPTTTKTVQDAGDEKPTIFSEISNESDVNAQSTLGITGGHATRGTHGGSAGRNITPDVGRDTYKLVYDHDGEKLVAKETDVSLNLPAPVCPPGPAISPAINVSSAAEAYSEQRALQKQFMFNSDDVNIDPRILQQWAIHEAQFQENTTPNRNGQFWAKNWEAWGPLDPFTPRQKNEAGDMEVTPGPTDPQLAYANALVASMDDQARKFCVSENPNDVTYQYRNTLQQIPGSHFETFDASWNAHETPLVVNRRAHLPQMAARWVVMQLNEKFRKEHPCFSISGREHFELSNPPQACGSADGVTQKHNPITLIRVFESRLLKVNGQVRQKLYLTLEIGNHVSAGSGGMFHTVVSIDDQGNFVDYTTPERDRKQTFVLPRTRTDAS